MSLAEHNNVVKALPSDRTDQPFGISAFAMGSAAVSAGHECPLIESSDEDLTIGPIPVTDQEPVPNRMLP